MEVREECSNRPRVDYHQPSGFFLLRTPLLPFDDLAAWTSGLHAASANSCQAAILDIRNAVLEDAKVLRQRLRAILERPVVLQAIFLASPSLAASVRYWKDDPTSKKGTQVEHALTRYFSRMAGRPTPFGLFSASSIGILGPDTQLVLGDLSQCKTSSRMDFSYLASLTDRLEAEFRDDLRWWPNTSFLKVGDSFRYFQIKNGNGLSSHTSVHLRADQYLRATLDSASQGASLGSIARHLRDSFAELREVSEDEIDEYLLTCVAEEILVTDLSPQSTGGSPLEGAFRALDSFPEGAARAQRIRAAAGELESIDMKGIGTPLAVYDPVLESLESLCPTSLAQLPIHVDLFRPLLQANVASEVAASMLSAVMFLSEIGAAPINPNRKLRKFRSNFRERYGAAWVPLAYALDQEFGIGIDGLEQGGTSPLLKGINGEIRDRQIRNELTSFHFTLLEKLVHCGREVNLARSDFDGQTLTSTQLPDAFSLTGTIVRIPEAPSEEVAPCVILRAGAGPSGVLTMARLAHLDAHLQTLVRAHVQQEELLQADAVFAEVSYLPRGHFGNILFRPRLRKYEIPYLGPGAGNDESQIAISDLLVTVAPDDDIVLYSKRLQKRVVPRLSSAHQFNNPMLPSVYRFLCYLQYEPSTTVPSFDWGPLNGLSFLPRVRFENIILSLATWNLNRVDIDGLLKASTAEDIFMSFQALRRRLDLPRWVSLAEGDHLLPVDFDNPLSLESAVQLIRRSGAARFLELLPPEQLCVRSENGAFQHELTVPYIRQPSSFQKPAIAESLKRSIPVGDSKPERTFLPGSLWTYFRIYAGILTLDEFIAGRLPIVIEALQSRHGIVEWFFVRYQDRAHHLRLRIKASRPEMRADIIALVQAELQPLLADGLVWKVELGTYEREIERYGGERGIELSEQVFTADCAAVLSVLSDIMASDDPMLRWQAAIVGIDCYMEDANLDVAGRLRLCRKIRDFLAAEFKPSQAMRGRIAAKVREHRKLIDTVLISTTTGGAAQGLGHAAFLKRSNLVRPCMRELRVLEASGNLAASVESIVASYLHMFINRLFAEDQRLHELVLYNMLAQAYEGRHAILASGQPV
jgi:thiopeptide-type bacteriocin biosynthesis protein